MAKTLSPQFTPRNDHYYAKTIWFREEIVKRGIKLCNIDTLDQLGDIFPKEFTRVTFECIWKKFMGWYISSIFSIFVTLSRGSIT